MVATVATEAASFVPIEPLLTPTDVARILGCSRGEVYLLVNRGELTPVPLPMRKTRFRRSDIEALIEGVTI
jgi:excisionase family DNA binding protein